MDAPSSLDVSNKDANIKSIKIGSRFTALYPVDRWNWVVDLYLPGALQPINHSWFDGLSIVSRCNLDLRSHAYQKTAHRSDCILYFSCSYDYGSDFRRACRYQPILFIGRPIGQITRPVRKRSNQNSK